VPRRVDAPSLLLEFLDWVAARPRTYADTVEAWRSNCPRHPVLDDAFTDRLIAVEAGRVVLTASGRDLVLTWMNPGRASAVPSPARWRTSRNSHSRSN
jgi:hypothetical protein